jgi:hypothetical protein
VCVKKKILLCHAKQKVDTSLVKWTVLNCSLSVCEGHRFILETAVPFHNNVDRTVKEALKMLCSSVTLRVTVLLLTVLLL